MTVNQIKNDARASKTENLQDQILKCTVYKEKYQILNC